MKIKFIHIFFAFILLGVILFGIALGGVFASFTKIDIEKEVSNKQFAIPTIIYDLNGNVLDELYQEKREIIPFKDIPENLIKAFIAYEDRDFYKHHGFNTKRLTASMLYNVKRALLKRGGSLVGGSTITQQLAKRLFTESEKTLFRKFRELWFTVQIEKKFSKNEILELYLNEIYFGHGVYGIKTASKLYFNKDVQDLTLGECAILAMLPQSPAYNSPLLHPENAMKRQKMVLERMVELDFITEEQAESAYTNFWEVFKNKKFSSISSPYYLESSQAPYYTDAVLQILKKDFTTEDIYKKGLRVYTACNVDYQKEAEKILNQYLDDLNENYARSSSATNNYIVSNYLDTIDLFLGMNNITTNLPENKSKIRFNKFYKEDIIDFLNLIGNTQNSFPMANSFETIKLSNQNEAKRKYIQGSIVSIDPTTGYVLTLVGGAGWTKQDQINRAIRANLQPGSGIKPFIYAGAMNEKIITPATIILDAPVIYQMSETEIWRPENYSGTYSGYVRVRDALRKSINVPAIKVMEALGINKAREYIAKFYSIRNFVGNNLAKSPDSVPPYLSTALGTIGVTPIQVAKGFSVLANQGREVMPIIIRYVTDREGKILKNYEKEINTELINMSPEELQIVTPQAAFLIANILRDTAAPGGTTYQALGKKNLDFEFATKTGTTQNWKDAWLNGFTPNLATVVWVGFDRASSLGKGLTGGIACGPIWGDYMQAIYDIFQRNKLSFEKPSNIISLRVDYYTGLIASSLSKLSLLEYFISGTQPKKIHNGYSYFSLFNPNSSEMEESPQDEEEGGSFFGSTGSDSGNE